MFTQFFKETFSVSVIYTKGFSLSDTIRSEGRSNESELNWFPLISALRVKIIVILRKYSGFKMEVGSNVCYFCVCLDCCAGCCLLGLKRLVMLVTGTEMCIYSMFFVPELDT